MKNMVTSGTIIEKSSDTIPLKGQNGVEDVGIQLSRRGSLRVDAKCFRIC